MKGHLTVYIGPMFSGKTTRLCQDLNHFADLPKGHFNVLYINSAKDVRSENIFSSNGSVYLSPRITQIKINELDQDEIRASLGYNKSIYDFNVIGIDEASFFDNLDAVVDWVDRLNKIIIVAGLDGSYNRTSFGKVVELIRYSDKTEKLLAKCHKCLDEKRVIDAPFTQKISAGGDLIDVGGSDKYMALCREHYLNYTFKHNSPQ